MLCLPLDTTYAKDDISSKDMRRAVIEINNSMVKKPTRKTLDRANQIVEYMSDSLVSNGTALCNQVSKNTRCNLGWSIKLEKNSSFNAYATSANKVVVFTGLIDSIFYEDELAFVIAHEIGHHAHNHIAKTKRRAILGAIAGGLLGATTGDTDITSQAMNIGAGLGVLSFSVEQEVEADRFAHDLLVMSDYNNTKARDVLIRMARDSRNISTQLLSSHPSGPERLHYFDTYRTKFIRD
ncbi:MAG: M48 family metalloprotease [Gammaproteobacteria bacterium]|jgi:predicted Zn-dependent protease|nr:M48 family metalloprotease [Gammaproteobacteria bacterium]